MMGVATTIATSPDEARTEPVLGTVVLTAEQPSLTIPFSLSLDGEPAVSVHHLERSVTYRSFSTSPPDQVESTPISITTVQTGVGEGQLVITLDQIALAPAEVQWQVYAETYADSANLLWGDSAPVAVLVLDSPENQAGPEPVGTIEITGSTYGEPPAGVWELPITVPAGEQLALLVPSDTVQHIRAGTLDAVTALRPGFPTAITRPESCDGVKMCSFSLWISSSGRAGTDTIAVHGPKGTVVGEPVEHELVATTQTFPTPTFSGTGDRATGFTAELQLPQPRNPLDDLTMFFHLQGERDELNAGGDAKVWTFVSIGRQTTPRGIPISACCEPLAVSVDIRPLDDKDSDDLFTEAGLVTVDVWSLTAQNPADFELTFSD